MKKTILVLSLLTSSLSVFASSTNDMDKIQKNSSNPNLYKQHQITIVKEEKHKFLFFPYTKEVLVTDFQIKGTDVFMVNQLETPYVKSISQGQNKETVIEKSVLKTGLSVRIDTSENIDKQTLTVNNSNLVSLEDFTQDDMTIQLPVTTQQHFTYPINQKSFEKTWTDTSGVTYKLIYKGEKTAAKS